jgi:hypothetical protein
MDQDQLKRELQRRLKLRQYPRRSAAQFTEENDHNPVILADCPRCSGRGHTCEHLVERTAEGLSVMYSTDDCPDCGGSGTNEELTRYFSNDAPPLDAVANEEGWLKCPSCGWRFSTKDKNVWTGRRHIRCGQKLNIIHSASR